MNLIALSFIHWSLGFGKLGFYDRKIERIFQKYKKLLLIILAVILILVIVFFSIPRGTKKTPAPAPTANIPGNELVQPPPAVPTESTPEQKSESSALASAASFAEIYGTYSNQSNYANIENVLPLASSQYRQELSATLSGLRASYKPGAVYEGTTTVVINKTAEALNDAAGTAIVLVKTQRKNIQRHAIKFCYKISRYPSYFGKRRDSWLVDSAKWVQ